MRRVPSAQDLVCAAALILLVAACSNGNSGTAQPPAHSEGTPQAVNGKGSVKVAARSAERRHRQVWFGDLHVHSGWSYDTFLIGTPATPDDAYRFARGKLIPLASGRRIQLKGPPLDFMAVTDHAEYLGELFQASSGDIQLPIDTVPLLRKMFAGTVTERDEAFMEIDLSLLDRPVEGLGVCRI